MILCADGGEKNGYGAAAEVSFVITKTPIREYSTQLLRRNWSHAEEHSSTCPFDARDVLAEASQTESMLTPLL